MTPSRLAAPRIRIRLRVKLHRAKAKVTPSKGSRGADARIVAELLDAFNREFDTETPGIEVLHQRLELLLAGSSTFAVLAASLLVVVIAGLLRIRNAREAVLAAAALALVLF